MESDEFISKSFPPEPRTDKAKDNATHSEKTPYQGIRLLVDRSGMSLISPTPVRLVPSAGPSMCDDIAMDAQVSPTPFLVTTSWKRF